MEENNTNNNTQSEEERPLTEEEQRRRADMEYDKNVGFRNPTEANRPSYYEERVKENLAKDAEESEDGTKISANRIISLVILLVIVLGYIIYAFLRDDVSASDNDKTALSGDVDIVGYFDGDSDYVSDTEGLTDSIDDFFTVTGVRVYIHDITGSVTLTESELQEESDEFFAQTFTDEETASRYLLITFQGNDEVGYAFTVGEEAQEIIDDEAIGILSETIDTFVSGDMDAMYVFEYTLDQASSEIMYGSSLIGFLIIFAFIAGYGIYAVWAKHKKKKEGGDDQPKQRKKLGSIDWKL